jgi:hypothetical protein
VIATNKSTSAISGLFANSPSECFSMMKFSPAATAPKSQIRSVGPQYRLRHPLRHVYPELGAQLFAEFRKGRMARARQAIGPSDLLHRRSNRVLRWFGWRSPDPHIDEFIPTVAQEPR